MKSPGSSHRDGADENHHCSAWPFPHRIAHLRTPANYLFPTFDHPHEGGRCSITGGYVYRGTIGSLPTGTYIYGDYCTGEIFTWFGGEQRLLLDTTFGISSFGEDDVGKIYVVDLNGRVSIAYKDFESRRKCDTRFCEGRNVRLRRGRSSNATIRSLPSFQS